VFSYSTRGLIELAGRVATIAAFSIAIHDDLLCLAQIGPGKSGMIVTALPWTARWNQPGLINGHSHPQ
jgi:hypothetical protein